MFTNSTRSMARWIVALPLLMVGSLMFWGMAISMGGLSLMRAITLASPPEMLVGPAAAMPDSYDGASAGGTIMIHLQESAEPQDLQDSRDSAGDNTGAGGVVAPDEQAVVVSGPGATSY
jgi:hypothetical protein